MSDCLTGEQAAQAWAALAEHCGAKGDSALGWHGFLDYVTDPIERNWEYRFCGSLGMGGKFHMQRSGRHGFAAFVSCYREDETPERREAIRQAEAALWQIDGIGPPPGKQAAPEGQEGAA